MTNVRGFERIARVFAILPIIGLMTSCAFKVASVDGQVEPPRWPSSPFPASVDLEPLDIPAGDQASVREDGVNLFLQTIDDRKLFARFSRSGQAQLDPDLRLVGSVRSHWNPRGAANFFTWFPGGLVWLPTGAEPG